MKARLLVVDEHPSTRELLVRHFGGRGMSVTAMPDGAGGLLAIEKAPFDVVILDLEMPGLSGLAVLRRIREQHSAADLPVIMISGRQDTESIVASLEQIGRAHV